MPNGKKYKAVYITRSDVVNVFTEPIQLQNNTIYDRQVDVFPAFKPIESNNNCVLPILNGHFLYGDGEGCFNFCKDFFKNTIQYQDFIRVNDLLFKKMKANILRTVESPRCSWYINALYSKVNITPATCSSHIIRPGVENYNWKDIRTISKWDLFSKVKRYSNYVDGLEGIIFESISVERLREYMDWIQL